MARRENPETALQRDMIELLEHFGFLVIRMPVGPILQSRGGKINFKKNPLKGIPDLLVFHADAPGQAGFLEVKMPDGRVSPEQTEWHARLKALGVKVAVVRSLDELRAAMGLPPSKSVQRRMQIQRDSKGQPELRLDSTKQ